MNSYQNQELEKSEFEQDNTTHPYTSEYLTTKQAAKFLGVSHQFLELARHRREGPPFVKLSRLVRYSIKDLNEYMNAHLQKYS